MSPMLSLEIFSPMLNTTRDERKSIEREKLTFPYRD